LERAAVALAGAVSPQTGLPAAADNAAAARTALEDPLVAAETAAAAGDTGATEGKNPAQGRRTRSVSPTGRMSHTTTLKKQKPDLPARALSFSEDQRDQIKHQGRVIWDNSSLVLYRVIR